MMATSWRRRTGSPAAASAAPAAPGRPLRGGSRRGHLPSAGSAPAAQAARRPPAPPTAVRASPQARPPAMLESGPADRPGNGRTRSPAGPPVRTACGHRRPPGSAQSRRRCPSVPGRSKIRQRRYAGSYTGAAARSGIASRMAAQANSAGSSMRRCAATPSRVASCCRSHCPMIGCGTTIRSASSGSSGCWRISSARRSANFSRRYDACM